VRQCQLQVPRLDLQNLKTRQQKLRSMGFSALHSKAIMLGVAYTKEA
jgi:hypothetical protein